MLTIHSEFAVWAWSSHESRTDGTKQRHFTALDCQLQIILTFFGLNIYVLIVCVHFAKNHDVEVEVYWKMSWVSKVRHPENAEDVGVVLFGLQLEWTLFPMVGERSNISLLKQCLRWRNNCDPSKRHWHDSSSIFEFGHKCDHIKWIKFAAPTVLLFFVVQRKYRPTDCQTLKLVTNSQISVVVEDLY